MVAPRAPAAVRGPRGSGSAGRPRDRDVRAYVERSWREKPVPSRGPLSDTAADAPHVEARTGAGHDAVHGHRRLHRGRRAVGRPRWRDLVARHDAAVRAQLKRHGGREVDNAGDGFFALFDRPASAIECAQSIVRAVRPLEIEVRAGIHTGEVEWTGSGARGISVHVASRVMAEAGPGEVVLTSTVRDLIAGSGVETLDRGTTALRGVDGEWHLFTVAPAAAEEALAGPASAAHAEGRRDGRRRGLASIAVIGLLALLGIVAAMLLLPTLLAGPLVPGPGTVARVPVGGDAFDAVVRVGQQPTAIAIGDDAIWVSNFVDGTLSHVDPISREVTANPAVAGRPSALAHTSDTVWVTSRFGRPAGTGAGVMTFDDRGVAQDTIAAGSGVDAIAADADGVWIADRVTDQVQRIDAGTRTFVGDPIAVGRAPGAVAIGEGTLWVTSTLDGTLWRIDPVSLESFRISLPGRPTGLAIGPDAVWVTSDTGDWLTRVDRTSSAIRTTPDLDGARGVAVAGNDVWVAVGGAGKLVRLDAASGTVTRELDVAGIPDAVAIGSDGSVWVTVRDP